MNDSQKCNKCVYICDTIRMVSLKLNIGQANDCKQRYHIKFMLSHTVQ